MTTQPKEEPSTKQVTIIDGPSQVIYADRILNFGLGPAVSKIALGMEVGENTFNQFAQLVLPTQGLFEVLEFMSNSIQANNELKQNLIQALEKFKEQLSKTE